MMGTLTRKQLIRIASEYFGSCYGLFTSKHYHLERWSISFALLLMLLLLLGFVGFAAATDPLWRWILDTLLVINAIYLIYLSWFVRWLNRHYKLDAGLSGKASTQELQKSILENLCKKYGTSLQDIRKEARETIDDGNFLTALIPMHKVVSNILIAITLAYGAWMSISLGPDSPAWLIVGVIVALFSFLFLQYAIVLRIAVWRIQENIIPSRYIPLHILLADLKKIDKETMV